MEIQNLTEYIEAIRGVDDKSAAEYQQNECKLLLDHYKSMKDPDADPDTKAYIERNVRYITNLKDSLDKYLKAVKSKRTRVTVNFPESTFFYRGQCNEYQPLPSVFRDQFLKKEDFLYHELILRCPENFRGLSHLDTLVFMQHYGLPTRLLDVTSNPLVALYFACKDYAGENEGKDGYVYIYRATPEITAYADSDRVLMLTCIPVFDQAEKLKILGQVNEGIASKEGGIPFTSGNRSYTACVERFMHEITKEVPAFKREIKAVDLIKPIFVKPSKANARILKQDGAFIISGLCYDREEAENRIRAMCGGVIKIQNREQILDELDGIGINEASLFPEVDKVAGYLKEKCR